MTLKLINVFISNFY